MNVLNSSSLICIEGKNNINAKYIGEISGSFFGHIRKSAGKRNLSFEITKEQVWDLYQHQNGKCVYSGEDLIFAKNNFDDSHGGSTASLDRKNSKLFYTHDNLAICHKDINVMKWGLSEEEFLFLCKKIYNHRNLKNMTL